MKTILTVILSFISYYLTANNTNEQLKKLNVNTDFYYETPFHHECFQKLSNAHIYNAGLIYRISEPDMVVFSTSHVFLVDGEKINTYNTVYQLFTSPEFLKTLRTDFKITTEDEAAIFQDFLYLIDQRSSWTSFFKQENDWFFIRRSSFDDIEAWKVTVNTTGNITSIEYSSKMAVTIPDEVSEIRFPSINYEEMDKLFLSDTDSIKILNSINGKIAYNESSEELTNDKLSAISNATFYRFSFSLEEEITDEDGTYTSTNQQVFEAIDYNSNMQLLNNFTEVLESPMFIESFKPSFTLKDEADATVFEAILDDFTDYRRTEKMVYFENDVWYFVRDESFDEKVGFAVNVNTEGKILSIKNCNPIGIEIIEEEFDEATADWGFKLLSPEYNSVEIVEGTPLNYAVEFNEKPATKMGAWIYARFNNENLDMYFGTDIYSPHYGDIKSEQLPIGKHTLDIYLMRPGMDTETALDKTSVEINVVPFNDQGVEWNFKMDEPKSNTVNTKAGKSVPVAFTFNAEEANRRGVRLEIYFEGQLVGGQKAPHLQSPFKTDIPGSELKQGNNKVEFVFAGGSKTLAKFEVNVVVE